jgi:hypothetical protein
MRKSMVKTNAPYLINKTVERQSLGSVPGISTRGWMPRCLGREPKMPSMRQSD